MAVSPADAGDWTGSIICATDLFDESTMDVFAESLLRILDEGLADWTAAGRIRLAGGWVWSAAARSRTQVLGELLSDAAARWGDRPAVTGDGITLTYRGSMSGPTGWRGGCSVATGSVPTTWWHWRSRARCRA